MGHEAIVSPVLETYSTHAAVPDGPFAAMIATSDKAFVALGRAPDVLAGLPLHVVGARSARAARAAGFRNIRSAAADARALAAEILTSERPPGPLLYWAGRDRKAALEDRLAEAGFELSAVIVYEARPVPALTPEAAAALAANRIDAILHFSRRSAEIFVARASAAGCLGNAMSIMQMCLSEDVSVPLREAGALRVTFAEGPDEIALLRLLERL
jgi:uroporphyrinogen-III synthase